MLFGLGKIILRNSRNNIKKQIHKDLNKLNRDIKNLPCKTWKKHTRQRKECLLRKKKQKSKIKNKNQKQKQKSKTKKYNNNIPYIY